MYHYRYVLKEKEPPSQALIEGRAVHDALDQRIKGKPLPAVYMRFSPMAESIVAAVEGGIKVYSELKMGLTRGMEACGFWDDTVWGRGAADVILKKDTTAMIFDWKTGKKREKEDQLFILALFTFKHFPAVETITGMNLWLEPGDIGRPYKLSRSNAPKLWEGVLTRIQAVEKAYETKQWPEKPSGLCGYCPVKSCQYNKS